MTKPIIYSNVYNVIGEKNPGVMWHGDDPGISVALLVGTRSDRFYIKKL